MAYIENEIQRASNALNHVERQYVKKLVQDFSKYQFHGKKHTKARRFFLRKVLTIGLQNVHTPYALCEEILGKLKDTAGEFSDKTFCVLFNLEFVEVLIYNFGVKPEQICFFADDPAEYMSAVGLYGFKDEQNIFLIDVPQSIKQGKLVTNMGEMTRKFDVICMNPPYQVEDGGHSRSAKPIYHHFVEMAIERQPNYLVAVTPSRWMVGGKGLDDFRQRMMKSKMIKSITHFPGERQKFADVSIKGGVSYLIWDKNHNGDCEFIVGETSVNRFLDAYDIIIQDNDAIQILQKIQKNQEQWMNFKVFGRKPFGLATNFKDWKTVGTPCYSIGKKVNFVGEDFTDKNNIQNKWKVAVSKATVEGASFTGNVRTYINGGFIIEPGTICTETYIIVNVFDSKKEADNFIIYMKTKFFRFMLGLRLLTQDVNKEKFAFVPDLEDYTKPWTDTELYKKFVLTQKEQAYIESKIKELK